MIVCDKCMSKNVSTVEIVFRKVKERKVKRKEMLNVPMILCEKCITDLLSQFGTFKAKFVQPIGADNAAV